jgi:hypothetical protein
MDSHRKNPHFRPFFILLFAAVLLAILSYVDIGAGSSLLRVKRIDILANLRATPHEKQAPDARPVLREIPAKGALRRSGTGESAKEKDEAGVIADFGQGGKGSLDRFFEALQQTEETGKKVRIAYFGDSLIEGDLITQDIRSDLQKRFGGRGVGFVPITSVSAGFRRTIHHAFSGNWESVSVLHNNSPTKSPGLSGFLFVPKSNPVFRNISVGQPKKQPDHSWVKYGTSGSGCASPAFDSVDLIYENPGSRSILQYMTEDESNEKVPLEPTSGPSRISLDKARARQHLKLMFFPPDPLKVYGMAFEAENGVYVDNFSLRGNSGVNVGKISCRTLADFNKLREYKLIVLHYGSNVANPSMTDFAWYEKKMTQVVNQIKECLPEAGIIIVSVNDICTGQEEPCTVPSVPHLVDAQRQVAREAGVGFWNLYAAMGGRNSMARWVRGKPPMANPDCTHLNNTGAKAVGRMFSQALMNGYDKFKEDRVSK